MPAYWARISTLGALPGAADTAKTSPDGSIQSRGTENLAAVLIFADHPVVGVGPGLYPAYYREYADRLGDYSNQFDIKIKNADRQAHTLYLGLLAETGILGFVSFMGAVVVTLYYLNRIRRRCLAAGKTELTHLASSFMLAIFAYLITGAFLHLAYARYFFFVLALGACASTIAARAATEEDRNPDDVPSQLRFWARRPWSVRRRRVRVGEPVRA
jgi:O-antigen ligase